MSWPRARQSPVPGTAPRRLPAQPGFQPHASRSPLRHLQQVFEDRPPQPLPRATGRTYMRLSSPQSRSLTTGAAAPGMPRRPGDQKLHRGGRQNIDAGHVDCFFVVDPEHFPVELGDQRRNIVLSRVFEGEDRYARRGSLISGRGVCSHYSTPSGGATIGVRLVPLGTTSQPGYSGSSSTISAGKPSARISTPAASSSRRMILGDHSRAP